MDDWLVNDNDNYNDNVNDNDNDNINDNDNCDDNDNAHRTIESSKYVIDKMIVAWAVL